MHKPSRALIVAALFGLLAGCGTPTVRYRVEDKPDLGKPVDAGSIAFRLRTSDIVLIGEADKTKDFCKADADPAKAWPHCLDAVKVLVSPGTGSQRYRATPDDLWLHHTKLAATTLGDDPDNLDSVAVAYTDDTAAFITRVGGGAVAGFALGGPIGAVVVAGLSAVAAPERMGIESRVTSTRSPLDEWHVCPDQALFGGMTDDMKRDYLDAAAKKELTSQVAYVIGLESAETTQHCWHAIPLTEPIRSDAGPTTPAAWTGWAYRLVLLPLPDTPTHDTSGSTHSDPYFNDTRQTTFPYVPCQEAELKITWVTALQATPFENVRYRSIKLHVADPHYLRFASLPKGGTLKLGSICDANVIFGGYAGSSASADLDALLKAAASIKAAMH